MAGPEWNIDVAIRVNSDDPITWCFGSPPTTAPTPLNLAGASAVLTVMTAPKGGQQIAQLTSAAGQIAFGTIAVGAGSMATITATFLSALTSTLSPGTYFYYLKISQGALNGFYALGNFTINPSAG